MIRTLPPTSVKNETTFSAMKLTKGKRRGRMKNSTLNDLLTVQIQSPNVEMNDESIRNTPPEEDRRFNLADNIGCAFADEHYWVKTEAIINELKRDRLSLDVRKIAHLLRTEFKAEQTKVTIEKKEIRCWKIPREMVEGSRYSNNDGEALKKGHEKFVKAFEEKHGHGIYQKKSNY